MVAIMQDHNIPEDKKESEFDRSNEYLNDSDISDIVDFLTNHPEITSLNLSNNCIADEGIIQLCEYLELHPNITKLNLSKNNIDSAGMQKLAENTTLTFIDVSDNLSEFTQLEESQIWFESFMKLFDLNAEGGQCLGVSLFVIPMLIKTSGRGDLIRLNILLKKMSDTYREIKDKVLDSIISEEAEKEIKRTHVLTRIQENLQVWYDDLPIEEKNEINSTLRPILTEIYKKQSQSILKWLFPSEKKGTTLCFVLGSNIYTKEKFADKLKILREKALQEGCFVALEISAKNHSTAIVYNPIFKKWVFVDANKLSLLSRSFITEEQLVNQLFTSHLFKTDYSEKNKLSISITGYLEKGEERNKKIFSHWRQGFARRNLARIAIGGLMGLTLGFLIVYMILITGVIPGVIGIGAFLSMLAVAAAVGVPVGTIVTGVALKLIDKLTGLIEIPKPEPPEKPNPSQKQVRLTSSTTRQLEVTLKPEPAKAGNQPLLSSTQTEKRTPTIKYSSSLWDPVNQHSNSGSPRHPSKTYK